MAVNENVVLNQKLSTVTGVDSTGVMIVVVVVHTETMDEYVNLKQVYGRNLLARPKAEGWAARVKIVKVVVVEGYGDGFVLRTVVVGVTDKGCLVMLFDR